MYYLAYGSNLNMGQMKYRCPTAKYEGTAILEGWELLYKGSKTGAYLTIERAEGGEVPVGIWKVGKADLAALDRYEGYPEFYYRADVKITPVSEVNGRKMRAFIYIMHEDRPCGLPSMSYIRICEQGYKDFGFDTKFLDLAYDRTMRRVAYES